MSPQLQDASPGMFAFSPIRLSVLFIGISLGRVLQRHIPPSKVEALLDFQWEARLFSCCWFRSL